MSRRDDYDAFGDIINEQAGIFGNEQASLEPGLKKHDSVHTKPDKAGVVLQMTCQGCGRPTHMTVEWPEMVALKYGVNPVIAFRGNPGLLREPTPWEFLPHEAAWRPRLRCRQCNFHFPVRIEPHEPERLLAAGRRQGFILPRGEAEVSRIALQAAEAGQAARR
jgi:hypothetical protein